MSKKYDKLNDMDQTIASTQAWIEVNAKRNTGGIAPRQEVSYVEKRREELAGNPKEMARLRAIGLPALLEMQEAGDTADLKRRADNVERLERHTRPDENVPLRDTGRYEDAVKKYEGKGTPPSSSASGDHLREQSLGFEGRPKPTGLKPMPGTTQGLVEQNLGFDSKPAAIGTQPPSNAVDKSTYWQKPKEAKPAAILPDTPALKNPFPVTVPKSGPGNK